MSNGQVVKQVLHILYLDLFPMLPPVVPRWQIIEAPRVHGRGEKAAEWREESKGLKGRFPTFFPLNSTKVWLLGNQTEAGRQDADYFILQFFCVQNWYPSNPGRARGRLQQWLPLHRLRGRRIWRAKLKS